MTGLAKSPGIRYADNYISRSEQLHPVQPDLLPSISHNHPYVVTSHLVAAVSPVSPSFPNFPPPFVLPSAAEGNKRGAESRRGLLSSRPLAENSWLKLRCWLVNKIREKFGQEESMQRTQFPNRGVGIKSVGKGEVEGPATRYLRVIPNTSELSYVGNVP